MSITEQLRKKYPDDIIEVIRQRLGLDSDDSSRDEYILSLSRNTIFHHVVNWNGLMGNYADIIKYWVLDVYGVDLDEIE